MSSIPSSLDTTAGHLPEGTAADDTDALEQEAATWAVRCNAGLDAQGQAALQAWLAADARHAPALDAMRTSIAGVQNLPAQDLASWGLACKPHNMEAHQLERRLRQAKIPVLARMEHDVLYLDIRTIALEEESLLVNSLQEALVKS